MWFENPVGSCGNSDPTDWIKAFDVSGYLGALFERCAQRAQVWPLGDGGHFSIAQLHQMWRTVKTCSLILKCIIAEYYRFSMKGLRPPKISFLLPPLAFTSTLKDLEFLHEQAADGDADGIGSKRVWKVASNPLDPPAFAWLEPSFLLKRPVQWKFSKGVDMRGEATDMVRGQQKRVTLYTKISCKHWCCVGGRCDKSCRQRWKLT